MQGILRAAAAERLASLKLADLRRADLYFVGAIFRVINENNW